MLALTPARQHFGSQIEDGLDPSEQWTRKKQTKEQKKAAKKAKLDPANQKSALDVMKEREKKRKREIGMEDEDAVEGAAEDGEEKPVKSKKQKQELEGEALEARKKEVNERQKAKRDQKKEKKAVMKAKAEAKKAAKQDADLADALAERQAEEGAAEESDDDDNDDAEPHAHPTDLEALDVSGLADSDKEDDEDEDEDENASSAPTSPKVDSPAFDISTNHSEASSSSSITPPSNPVQPKQPKKELTQKQQSTTSSSAKADLKIALPSQKSLTKSSDLTSGTSSPKIHLPNIDQAELQERLRKRIEELRARRKADGDGGKPAKSRQELLEQRRKKEEQRKAHKKQLRQQAKEDEAQKREEQLRGSGSPLSTDVFSRSSPRPQQQENSFSFSRLAFEDGTAADASLTELHDPRKKKGPQDPRTALQAAEKKQARLSGLDAVRRADIDEKDMWLNAKKRAHGERVRDDTSLLKKALKRKEKDKNKSEKAWNERQATVVQGKQMKDKKREANLMKRRDEKGSSKKGGKKPAGKGSSGGGKKKSRAGFEGRFKA